jgi:alkanesulfonate monooxygenase SsuD/methylene tetrahydromethanopterin reductase-like flavin-dependent oxidoreductase (luciferase family)
MPGFTLRTVPQQGWSRTKNGALLRLAEAAGFDAFLTADQSLQYQQNLSASKLRIIVFATYSNRMEHVGPLLPQAMAALREMAPGELRIISGGS